RRARQERLQSSRCPRFFDRVEILRRARASAAPMTRLPVLDDLDRAEIASPCPVPWEGMVGDDRARFCGACKPGGHNVSALCRGEARGLIAAANGRMCMRLYRRADGTVMTADCWTLLRQARRRGLVAVACTLGLILWAQLATQAVGLWTIWRW